jgi:hypothetical protein
MRFIVSYIHMRQYRVSRSFDSYEAAEYFIDCNALVYPLPGLVRCYQPRNDTNFAWIH